jgi:hypothetical protein
MPDPHVHRICVLLPAKHEIANQVWLHWTERQAVTQESRVRWFAMGENRQVREWHAWGVNDVQRIKGYEFDEIVIAHPSVSHDLIAEARILLR